MSRRLMVAIAAIAVLGVSTTVAVAAKNPPAKKIRIVGDFVFKPGKSITDSQRFQSRRIQAKSGDTVNFVNKAKTEDPHTISVVETLPKGFDCEECGAIEESHQLDPNTGEPSVIFADAGADGGFNTAGDSIVVSPPGAPGSSGEIMVTAPAGTTLKLLCIIHPWMQAKLKVTG